jgi:hypothetical protein
LVHNRKNIEDVKTLQKTINEVIGFTSEEQFSREKLSEKWNYDGNKNLSLRYESESMVHFFLVKDIEDGDAKTSEKWNPSRYNAAVIENLLTLLSQDEVRSQNIVKQFQYQLSLQVGLFIPDNTDWHELLHSYLPSNYDDIQENSSSQKVRIVPSTLGNWDSFCQDHPNEGDVLYNFSTRNGVGINDMLQIVEDYSTPMSALEVKNIFHPISLLNVEPQDKLPMFHRVCIHFISIIFFFLILILGYLVYF